MALLCILISGCSKNRFPKPEYLIGTWVEETSANFHHKLVFDKQQMVFFKSTSTDTFNYKLDQTQKALVLVAANDPSAGQGICEIDRSSFGQKITVYGLFITRGDESITVFKKN